MKAVIFDCDGVIIDYEPVLVKMSIKLLKHYDIFLTKKEFIKTLYPLFVGRTSKQVLEIINKKYKKKIKYEDFVTYRYYERQNCFKEIVLMKNILPLLKYLKSKGYKLGLATSSDLQKMDYLHKKFPNVMKYFEIKLTAEDVVNGKPHPEVFIKTAKKLGVKAKDTIIIEDSVNGMHAAQAGSFKVIILKNANLKKSLYTPKPDYLIKDLIEIKEKGIL